MADTLDTIKKLVALATNNPSPMEAAAAAMKACQLIQEVGLGTGLGYREDETRRHEPSPMSVETVEEILNSQKPEGPATVVPVTGAVADDPWTTRMVQAWRAIKVEREKVARLMELVKKCPSCGRQWKGL